MTDYFLFVFQIQISYEKTTAEMTEQLTTIKANCTHLEEEVQYCKLKLKPTFKLLFLNNIVVFLFIIIVIYYFLPF